VVTLQPGCPSVVDFRHQQGDAARIASLCCAANLCARAEALAFGTWPNGDVPHNDGATSAPQQAANASMGLTKGRPDEQLGRER
jgi:hypothetical protein